MPLELPTYEEITDNTRVTVANSLPDTDPTIAGGLLNTLVAAVSSLTTDLYVYMNSGFQQAFPQTSTGERLDVIALWDGLSRNVATQSEGFLALQGISGTVIPLGTEFSSAIGGVYFSTGEVTIIGNEVPITLAWQGGLSVAGVAGGELSLASGSTVLISGAIPTEYNGEFIVTMTSSTSFTYELSEIPTETPLGSPIAFFDSVLVPIESEDFGEDQNLSSGAAFNITSPISGANTVSYASFDGIDGGASIESDEDFRKRIIEFRSALKGDYNEDVIVALAKTVPGVTRVSAQGTTPALGQTTVLFLRDDDANPIPNAAEVNEVYARLLTIKPVDVADEDLIVSAPTPVSVDFNFSSLTPDTATMRVAVEQNLNSYFTDNADIGDSLTEMQYESAILSTIDTTTGEQVTDFTLTTPSGDIPIESSEVALVGIVTYS